MSNNDTDLCDFCGKIQYVDNKLLILDKNLGLLMIEECKSDDIYPKIKYAYLNIRLNN